MPIRTFVCLRRRCQHQFDSWADDPYCPSCGGKPCKNVPVACNIGRSAPGVDRTVRMLVDEHNQRNADFPAARITDFRAPEAGQPLIRPPTDAPAMPYSFNGPGGVWNAQIPQARDQHGRLVPVASCTPSPSIGSKASVRFNQGGALDKAPMQRFSGIPIVEIPGGKARGPAPHFEASTGRPDK